MNLVWKGWSARKSNALGAKSLVFVGILVLHWSGFWMLLQRPQDAVQSEVKDVRRVQIVLLAEPRMRTALSDVAAVKRSGQSVQGQTLTNRYELWSGANAGTPVTVSPILESPGVESMAVTPEAIEAQPAEKAASQALQIDAATLRRAAASSRSGLSGMIEQSDPQFAVRAKSKNENLAGSIAQSVRPDCLRPSDAKEQVMGGLLALPSIALAALTGKCR